MARKRMSAREKAQRETKESLAMVKAQIATMEAATKALKLAVRDLENRAAVAARLEVIDDGKPEAE